MKPIGEPIRRRNENGNSSTEKLHPYALLSRPLLYETQGNGEQEAHGEIRFTEPTKSNQLKQSNY